MKRLARAEINILLKPNKCYKSGKPVYDKKGATTAKNACMTIGHRAVRIYECNYCKGWHLTHEGMYNKVKTNKWNR